MCPIPAASANGRQAGVISLSTAERPGVAARKGLNAVACRSSLARQHLGVPGMLLLVPEKGAGTINIQL